MKKISAFLISILLISSFFCSCSQTVEKNKPLVVVSILPFEEFVSSIAGDYVDVMTMIPQGSDPHTFDPAPSQMTKLSDADMYVKVGAGLEFEITYMEKIETLNTEMLVVDASSNISLLDNNDEDSSSSSNPHIWLSVKNSKIICANIYNGLCTIDPDHISVYTDNYNCYIEKLNELDYAIEYGLSNITNRKFMVLHPQWEYYAEDYDLTEIAIEVDGKEPGAQTLAELIKIAKQNDIHVILTSPQFSDASADAIAEAIDGKVVAVDGLAKNYIENMYSVLDIMQSSMK